MTESAPTAAEHEALRARLAALSAASLRISASLDLETVLTEVVESARTLTGARFGAIATIDETGTPRDFVTSGFTEEEHRRLAEWADGPRLFEHFRDLEGPLRIADVPAYVRALGFPTDRLPSKTFQGTPMRHRGVHVGNFYLVEKAGGAAFTDEDEQILVLFAAQAATAIANARTYRAERRARADLEALIETSPVGVVVFDGGTGQLVSLNREATRLVQSLCDPGQSAEQLLGVITCRRGDGREIALDQIPLAGALSGAETVRAEEIELSVPDGRRVTTLINATPIHGEDGAVASVVVTMQDLAPLQALERMRAEFLGMVSHELRVPLSSIKGSAAAALGAARLVAPAETREFFRIIDDQADRMIGLIADLLDAGRIEAGTLSVAPEPSEVAALVEQARSTFISGGGRHAVGIDGGLGLAICKGLVEAHGGRIRAESGGLGLGTRVTFTIPVAGPAGDGRGAHPRGRRRPGHATPCSRHAHGGGLRAPGHRRPPGAVAHPPDREAPAGAARPDAARDRRDPTDADRAGTRRPPRHLHLGLRARRDHRAGA